jgi:DNA polymerase I
MTSIKKRSMEKSVATFGVRKVRSWIGSKNVPHLSHLVSGETLLRDLGGWMSGFEGVFGLDLETTDLSGRWASGGRVRLLQIYRGDIDQGIVIDVGECGLEPFKEVMEGHVYVAHNAVFEQTWFVDAGIHIEVHDTMLAYSSMVGGVMSLAEMSKRLLGVELDKSFQKGGWSREKLSDEQIGYAFTDAWVVAEIWDLVSTEMDQKDCRSGYEVLLGAVPMVVEMQLHGFTFDVDSHAQFIAKFQKGYETAESYLRWRVGDEVENWGSVRQIDIWFEQKLADLPREERRKVCRWPKTPKGMRSYGSVALSEAISKGLVPRSLVKIFRAYAVRQKRAKIISSFGESLLGRVYDGRIKGNFSISRAKTGRMSSDKPNFQNFPNGKFRELFVATKGHQLVICDYSQIEVRCQGEMADEDVFREIFTSGGDFHYNTASAMFNKRVENVTKEERRRAKALTFGIQYGMGTASIARALGVDTAEAEIYLQAWLDKYPKVRAWRDRALALGQTGQPIRTAGGRLISGTSKFVPAQLVNFPVQGSAGDVLYNAMRRVMVDKDADVKALSVVHDEIILECPTGKVEDTKKMLESAMANGYLDVFPDADITGIVDAESGDNWGAK